MAPASLMMAGPKTELALGRSRSRVAMLVEAPEHRHPTGARGRWNADMHATFFRHSDLDHPGHTLNIQTGIVTCRENAQPLSM